MREQLMFRRFNFFKQYLILLTKNNKLQEQINELEDSNKKLQEQLNRSITLCLVYEKTLFGTKDAE